MRSGQLRSPSALLREGNLALPLDAALGGPIPSVDVAMERVNVAAILQPRA